MIMNKIRLIVLFAACHLWLGMVYAQQDSIIVYNDQRPVIYEDAWDLWPYVFLNEKWCGPEHSLRQDIVRLC